METLLTANFNEIFEPELIRELNELAEIELPAGQVILKENAYIREIPLLIDGHISVRKSDSNGKEIVLYSINPGESCILSITSCLTNNLSKAEAVTDRKTRIKVITSDKLLHWMDVYKSWRKFVQKLYYLRLDELLSLVDEIAFRQIDYRLINKLKEKASEAGSNEIELTHQMLANELGTAREVISRLLKQLEKDGKIELSRGKIKIVGLV